MAELTVDYLLSKKISGKVARFVMFYIKHRNGSKAAKLAGFNCSSDGSFRSTASQLLKKPTINAVISEQINEIDRREMEQFHKEMMKNW